MNGEIQGLRRRVVRSAAVVGACTAASRVLGLVREIAMAWFFGTSLAKSAFDVAFLIPNLFRRLFGEGALSAAFVPVFSETLEKQGRRQAALLAGRVMTLLGVVLGGVVLAGIAGVSVVMASAPVGARTAAVLPLLRIMLPYAFFICVVALCMAILNSFHRFAVPAITPVLLNVVWIVALVAVCPLFGPTPAQRIEGAAWAVLAAGAIQLLVQVPALLRVDLRPVPSLNWRGPGVRRVLLLMGPAAVGMGVFQVNAFLDRVLAMVAAPWAPAALTYAERLIYLPLGVFATALGTVLLPTFSLQAAREEKDEILRTLSLSLRGLMLVMMPAAVGLAVLSVPVVRLLFVWHGGEFDANSTLYTARAVCFYAPGLVVFSLYKVFVPAFYAGKDTVTPVRVGVRVVFLNLALNILFLLTWAEGYKHAGLAFATVLSSAVNSGTLVVILQRRLGSPGWKPILASWGRTLAASLAMGAVTVWLYRRGMRVLSAEGPVGKAPETLLVLAVVTAGIVCYAGLAWLLNRRDFARLMRLRRSRSADRS